MARGWTGKVRPARQQWREIGAIRRSALVVDGFVKDFLQHVPIEFVVEAQILISISLEGSVA
jgi:Fe-S cluster assembly protein SufB